MMSCSKNRLLRCCDDDDGFSVVFGSFASAYHRCSFGIAAVAFAVVAVDGAVALARCFPSTTGFGWTLARTENRASDNWPRRAAAPWRVVPAARVVASVDGTV